MDEDRVFLGGISDGATGSMVMALHHPTPWAGFVALSGSIVTASQAPDQAFPANLANRPVHAANGGLDLLYPSLFEKIFIDQLTKLGARIAWTEYPASGHDPSYMRREVPKVNQFILKTVRDPVPKHLVWETADPGEGRCDWIEINEVRAAGNKSEPEPSNLVMTGPAEFLVTLDEAFAGPGIRIRQALTGGLGALAGLRPNDVLTRLNGVAIKTRADFWRFDRTEVLIMKKGDTVHGEYQRGREVRSFRVEVPELSRVPLFKRSGPAGRLEVKTDGNRIDVTARGIARYTLLLQRRMFDRDQPIHVVTNGAKTFRARVAADPGFMLEQSAKDDDRSTIYYAKLEVDVP